MTANPQAVPLTTEKQTASLRQVLIGATSVLLIALFAYWVVDRLGHVYVSDARVASTMIALSAQVSGRITEIVVEEGQHIEADQLIAVIDPREARYTLLEAESAVAVSNSELLRLRAERSLESARIEARIDREKSQLTAAEFSHEAAQAELNRSRGEWERAEPLLAKQVISRERWEEKLNIFQQADQAAKVSGANIQIAAAALDEAQVMRKQLDVYDSQIERVIHEKHNAEAQMERLSSVLNKHQIRSPITGVVDELFVDPGEYAIQAQRLLVIHNPNKVWVSANIKETDIRHLKVGDAAKVRVDAFPGREFIGTISRIGNAATSQFALLPSPNPSGNFTKITQRIEVRIELDQDRELLKPGMMVEVEIEI